tara:strand:+ start:195 stop:380 length:186 start_codon:yes stop_codon:yes gene_type:complete
MTTYNLNKEIFYQKEKNKQIFQEIQQLKIDYNKYIKDIKECKKLSLSIIKKYEEILQYKIE